MYYIIRKVHIVDNELTYTPIGYTLTDADAKYIHDYDAVDLATQWTINNIVDLKTQIKSNADFFTENSLTHFYVSGFETKDITDMELNEITNLDNPEGV